MTDRVLANLVKNGRETLRVAVAEFKGSTFVDLRTFATSTSGEAVPTKVGVTIPPRLLREVITALEAAERDLSATGAAR